MSVQMSQQRSSSPVLVAAVADRREQVRALGLHGGDLGEVSLRELELERAQVLVRVLAQARAHADNYASDGRLRKHVRDSHVCD